MGRSNVAVVIVPGRKGSKLHRHYTVDSSVAYLPWPVGSAEAHRFWNQRAHKRNHRNMHRARNAA
jgi:hypothetical protein